ncbi:unnamed protein product [Echinostoma caproni]|uniref:Pinin_SDK_memA domain-containing protein n=1 Tax=Echinostoma caproni TaxID=27848 RepID=A0A183A6X9_9TREM|nr:unnamed protein product [Echinostoma caproni]
MLGILQGTLNQFRAESAAAVTKPQMAKRREIDAKLEARAEKEREVLRRERAELFRARREQQLEVALLQEKMRVAKGFELWKDEMEKMMGFCRTEVSPHIFFQPKVHNQESRRRTEATASAIRDMINRRKRKLDINFEETCAARRRFLGPQANKDKVNDDRDSPKSDDHPSWSSISRDGPVLNSLVSNAKSTSAFESSVSKTASRRPDPSDTEHADSGDESDASETFAIEGDEEPLLMEEEHLTATANTSGPVHSPLDRTVASSGPNPDSPQSQRDILEAIHQSPSGHDDTRTVRLE